MSFRGTPRFFTSRFPVSPNETTFRKRAFVCPRGLVWTRDGIAPPETSRGPRGVRRGIVYALGRLYRLRRRDCSSGPPAGLRKGVRLPPWAVADSGRHCATGDVPRGIARRDCVRTHAPFRCRGGIVPGRSIAKEARTRMARIFIPGLLAVL